MDKLRLLFGMICLTFTQFSYAVVIPPNTIIASPVLYNHTVIDLTQGNFIVKNNGSLIIKNSQIIGTLSAAHPSLILVESGYLRMVNNEVTISAPDIVPHPMEQSLAYVIRLEQASVELIGNQFKMDKAFVGGLMISNINQPTANLIVRANQIENFHGALYLLNSSNANISNNVFTLNSYGNIVLMGKNSRIIQNKIYFSGQDHLGNAIDILNSADIDIRDNLLFTPTCHGIYVFLSENINIEDNNIIGGITYAITLLSKPESYLANLFDIRKTNRLNSKNILVKHNFMSQNRYGMNATDIDGLVVQDNYFSQRFTDNLSRQFWTDNNILFKGVTGLVWSNNKYKEAFTQDNAGSNLQTHIVTFPEIGGVSL